MGESICLDTQFEWWPLSSFRNLGHGYFSLLLLPKPIHISSNFPPKDLSLLFQTHSHTLHTSSFHFKQCHSLSLLQGSLHHLSQPQQLRGILLFGCPEHIEKIQEFELEFIPSSPFLSFFF